MSDASAWSSLVRRSILVWDEIFYSDKIESKRLLGGILQNHQSLDAFLGKELSCVFWFFQRRSAFYSQNRMTKWSPDDLEDYIILPAAPGYVSRMDCFFVSHYWQSQDHPDPDGKYLALNQAQLEPQSWSYIWVDWTCMPQSPRSLPQETYFHRCLRYMSGVIRNCGFIYFYPPFEARLWILYELAENKLTSDGEIDRTSDNETFLNHIDEMFEIGVQNTLVKHGYRCSNQRDRNYLVSWLELLVLLRRLHIDTYLVRRIMDDMTYHHAAVKHYLELGGSSGVRLNQFEGTLAMHGTTYTFTPFPQDDGSLSQS